MRKYVFTLMCAILFLQAIPMVSAQAQLPPPNYRLYCSGLLQIDVDPETSTPPTDGMGCSIVNDESYSLELSISSSELDPLSAGHNDSIVVGANAEEFFSVEILGAVDRMEPRQFNLKISTEVTKTGGFDYSDDDPQSIQTIVNIMQYAAFRLEPQQTDSNQKLEDKEDFVLSYIITNEGNDEDTFRINTFSYTSRICDEDQPLETGSDASECVLKQPVSYECDEELTIIREDKEEGGFDHFKYRTMEPGESFTVTFTVSSNIDNASCWPIDSNDNFHLEFTHIVRAFSEFGLTRWYSGNDVWGQYDDSPIWIERTVDVTKSNDEGIIASAVPGFESSYLIMCIFLAAMIHNRKSSLY